MSQSEAGPSRRRNRYAPQACNVCRRRKCKCDGVFPVCQPCAASRYECSWIPEGDGDRPATKQLVQGLRAKIQSLEAEIYRFKQEAVTSIPSSGGGPDAEFSSAVPQSTYPSGGVSHIIAEPSLRVEHDAHHPPYQVPPQPHLATQPHLGSNPLLLSHLRAPLINNQTDEPMATEVNTRLLTYQYIFDISLNEPSPEHQPSLLCEWDRHLPALGSIQLSRHEHDVLLFRCFSYGGAWLFGLLPALFLRDMLEFLKPSSTHQPGELQHYSPLLHCSLLAFASPLSDNPVIQQPSTREKFATHAKQWLDDEFSYANPSLIPSLILLSEYHLAVGEINAGYMYTGMSMRAVRAGTASTFRDWYRWSAYIHEKLLAHEMNRPSEMLVPARPIELPVSLGLDNQPVIADSCFIHCAKLMSISTTISNGLNGATTENMRLQLEAWLSALPDNLLVHQLELLVPPPILALHICYWWSILQLFPPSAHRETSQSMHHATEKLVELFGIFDNQFGFRYFPRNLLKAVHTCGRALILERLSENGIDLCLKGLRTWPCAEPMLVDLVRLKSSMGSANGVGTPED